MPETGELEALRRERDLYRRILKLGQQDDLEPFLREALGLIVEVTGAAQGYLEVRDTESDATWSMAHAFSSEQLDDVRSTISRGIVAAAVATGRTILTHAALLDERFRERESVQAAQLQAVLCTPIGGDARRGVVYLHGPSGAFSDLNGEQAEMLAEHLAPLADRLVVRRRVNDAEDATRGLRERYRIAGIVGRSEALARALEQGLLAAPIDVNVLITGESGTGKSQLARAIHDNSPRHAGPFVELNCATLPESLVESELFGALKGSHSEARADSEGKVAAASGGTLFLDEIAELPYEAQAKLLQLLQSKRYYRLGASQPTSADIRLIAATNTELERAVEERRFREDLYYRLQVLPVRMPSLAERRGDLPELSRALLERVCDRHGFEPYAISAGGQQALAAADWPGNVRQLENTLEAAAIRAHGRGAHEVGVPDLFPGAGVSSSEAESPATFQEATRAFQRELLRRALEETNWNVSEAARRLDLARSHVYNLINAFALKRG